MGCLKEITVFALNGNPRDITTWSNIPYFLVKSLEDKGIKVNCVALNPSRLLYGIYRHLLKYLYIDYLKNSTYTYFRSYMHFIDINQKIKKNVREYSNSDAFIFTTFSFSAYKYTSKPTILLCDWNYEYYLNYFKNRKPKFFEIQSIKRENKQIQNSEIVISLYPGVKEYMSYKNSKNILYFGSVINSIYSISSPLDIIRGKDKSNSLLFIGKKHYNEGAVELIKAFSKLKNEKKNLKLHIIGMESNDFDSLPDDVICYGYLNKSIERERELYYSLLYNAKLIINTTPMWGGFSSIIEAMYYYNPVITSPYKEFILTFGEEIQFGNYVTNRCDEIYRNVKDLMNNPNYNEYCLKAHEAVKLFTWENYIFNLINLLRN